MKTHCVVVLCAKLEELRAVRRVFHGEFDRFVEDDKNIDQVYAVGRSGSGLTMLVSTCGKMGNMAAAIHTSRMVSLYKPEMVFFVGTAASMAPEDVQVGDVVIPRKAVYRLYEKISEEGNEDYDKRMEQGSLSEKFLENNVLCAVTDSQETSPRAQTAISGPGFDEIELQSGAVGETLEIGDQHVTLRESKIHFDEDIFTCGMVVDSVSYREFAKRVAAITDRKLTLIDMESYGFLYAIEQLRGNHNGSTAEGVMVRGVSDYAGRKRLSEELPQGWKDVSVENAARVVVDMINEIFPK